jgi:hypothetical protein
MKLVSTPAHLAASANKILKNKSEGFDDSSQSEVQHDLIDIGKTR